MYEGDGDIDEGDRDLRFLGKTSDSDLKPNLSGEKVFVYHYYIYIYVHCTGYL